MKAIWQNHRGKIIVVLIILYLILTVWVYINYHPYSTDYKLQPEERQFEIEPSFTYKNGLAKGEIIVTNIGRDYTELNGKYPIHVGISLVGEDGTVIDQDYQHLEIPVNSLRSGESCEITEVALANLSEVYANEGRLRFAIIQEGVNWNCDYIEIMLSDID